MLNKFKLKSAFFHNVLTLMTGTTIAQAIPIAISPILTRIYSPEEFGLFALYMAIMIIVAVIATGRYELAIMLPVKDDDARKLVVLSTLVAILISLLLLCIVIIFNDSLAILLGNPEIANWLYLLPVSVFFSGVYQSLTYWNSRKKQYKVIAKSRIAQSTAVASGQMSVGFLGDGGAGLISGHLFGQGVASVVLGRSFLQQDNFLLQKIKKVKILALARRYKDFPRVNMWSALLNTASVQAPIILLNIVFNAAITGFFALAQKILLMPMTLMGTSVAQVYYQQISTLKNDTNEIKKITLNVYKKLLLIGVFPIALILAFGDIIFAFVFGERWREAGVYAQLLSIWVLFVFASSPLSHLLTYYEMHRQSLFFNSILFFSRVLIIFLGAYFFNNVFDTILLYGIVGAILWAGFAFYVMSLAGIKYSETIKYTSPYLVVCFIAYMIGFYV